MFLGYQFVVSFENWIYLRLTEVLFDCVIVCVELRNSFSYLIGKQSRIVSFGRDLLLDFHQIMMVNDSVGLGLCWNLLGCFWSFLKGNQRNFRCCFLVVLCDLIAGFISFMGVMKMAEVAFENHSYCYCLLLLELDYGDHLRTFLLLRCHLRCLEGRSFVLIGKVDVVDLIVNRCGNCVIDLLYGVKTIIIIVEGIIQFLQSNFLVRHLQLLENMGVVELWLLWAFFMDPILSSPQSVEWLRMDSLLGLS